MQNYRLHKQNRNAKLKCKMQKKKQKNKSRIAETIEKIELQKQQKYRNNKKIEENRQINKFSPLILKVHIVPNVSMNLKKKK